MVAANRDMTPTRWMVNQADEQYINRKDLLAFMKNDSNKHLQSIPGAKYISEWLICVLKEMGEPEDHKERDTGEYVWNNDASLRYVFGEDGLYIRHSDLYNLLEMKGKREKDADFTKTGIEYVKCKLEFMLTGQRTERPDKKDK